MSLITSTELSALALLAGVFLLGSYIFDYFFTNRALMDIPGPFLAKYTRAWLAQSAFRGRTVQDIHKLHQKYGKLIRLQPNFISVSDDSALPLIYGHSSKLGKTEFYDAFSVAGENIFTTRSRSEHARRRRFMAHAFSAQSLSQFEPYIDTHIKLLLQRLDEQVLLHTTKTAEGVHKAPVDVMPWFNYQTLDVISDLAFGRSLNMLQQGGDLAQMFVSPDSPPEYHSAIDPINWRARLSPTLGFLPPLKLFVSLAITPSAKKRKIATERLGGMAYACVKQRIDNPTSEDRKDILYRMIEARDEKGGSLSLKETVADSTILLIAGSDTTAHTLALACYHLARNPQVLAKLEKEIADAVPEDVEVPPHAFLQHLPYLDGVIKETLRLHSLVGLPLPREIMVGSQGLELCGHFLPPGTVVGVPAYTLHRSPEIWGPDVEEFRPERWAVATSRQKAAFIPFSIGSRACVGRSLAEMELRVTTAAVVKRFSMTPGQTSVEFDETGLLRKADAMTITMEKK